MATYTLLKQGSRGSAVSDLQKLLNNKGYSLDVDGIFGSKTQSAVRDYQYKNNLTVDGIVGNNTWGALYGTGGTTGSTSSTGSTGSTNSSYNSNSYYSPTNGRPVYSQSQAVMDAANLLAKYEAANPGDYQQSQAVTDALNTLEQFETTRPGGYQSNYADQIQGLLDKIINREDFTYNFSADPMYQMYADQYQQKGQMAMMDTMGQAAALTGGYGSTYAQNVGQQAYNAYLQELNNIIPELRDAAYQMYRDEGTDMYNQIGLLQGLEESDYSRYRDAISDYLNERNYLYSKYFDLSSMDYDRYRDDMTDFYTDRNYYYGRYSDMSDDEYNRFLTDLASWESDRDYAFQQEQFAYQQAQDALAQANWEREFALAQQQAAAAAAAKSAGSGSSSKSSNTNKSTSNTNKSTSNGNSSASSKSGNNDYVEQTRQSLLNSAVNSGNNAYVEQNRQAILNAASDTYTDWTQVLNEASDEERQEILYGTTAEGRRFQQQLVAELGEAALGRYRRHFG